MRTVLLLALYALPVYAQAPVPDILITGDERAAIIAKFNEMDALINKLGKSLTNCRAAQRT